MSPIRPYAESHRKPDGPGDARPTALDVIRDQDLTGKLHGHVILITGCTSGIGVETARALYSTGSKIYITARDMAKGLEVAADLSVHAQRPVEVLEMRLDSFNSIRAAAKDFFSKESKLNVLINNAGIMGCPYATTDDGFESQFGTNHLGHFLLFQLLKPALLAAATPLEPSRVISVSSTGHRLCTEFPFDDLDFSKTPYSPMVAYGRSKLANIYFANELDRQYKDRNLHALSLHPGSIYTPLRRHLEGQQSYKVAVSDPDYQLQSKSAEQGAATTVWAAVGKEWSHRGGVYLEDVGEAGKASPDGPSFRPGYGDAAYSPDAERRLWELSSRLCAPIE